MVWRHSETLNSPRLSACSELLAYSLLVREEVLLADLCKRKILFLYGNTVHVNSVHVKGLGSTSQPAALAELAVCKH